MYLQKGMSIKTLKKNNYLLTYDFSGPVYNSVQGPLPPTDPSNTFAPRKSIIHRARKISGQ
jgi:hypothetical protein